MSSDEKDLDIAEMFYASLALVADQATSPSDLLKVWISLGKHIGLEDIIPHLKVVLYEDGDGEKNIVGVIASPSEDVVNHLSSENVFNEMLCQASVRSLKEMKDVIH